MNQLEKNQKLSLQRQINLMVGLAGQIAGVTLFLILLAVFGGIWLDRLLGTRPIILIILVVGAGPLSLFSTFKLALRATQSVQSPTPAGTKNPIKAKEDDTGE